LYRHTQVGWVIIGALGAALVLDLWWLVAIREQWVPGVFVVVPAVVGAILFFSLLIFRVMTIEVDSTALRWWFGGRLWTHSAAINEIEVVKSVQTPFWHGWGIHWVGGGWLYNVSGRSAVEVRLSGGKFFRLGTDDPERLLNAIRLVAPLREG
jgi:hypothetical protein